MLAVQNYLENHFTKRLTLKHVAHEHNMTERTLIRRFKQACAITPIQYLQGLRLEQARKILETSMSPLESIINSVGYEDLSSFTRLFKKNTGLSPSQYRAKFIRK